MPERKHNPRQPAELRVRGVRLFKENRPNYSSDSAACASIAEKLGCSRFTLRQWRIPADYEIPGDRGMIRRDGEQLIFEPVRKENMLEVLADLHPLGPEDEFPDIDGSLPRLSSCDDIVCARHQNHFGARS